MQKFLIDRCRACGGALEITMADLGLQPPSNAYLPVGADISIEQLYPLRAKVCRSCMLVQTDCDVPPGVLFDNYAYFSSYSEFWLEHCRRFAEMAVQRFQLDASSYVVELASNDGYLLKYFIAMGIQALGIDPSDTVSEVARRNGIETLTRFFGSELARELSVLRQADLIVANNVLAHVPDINDFVGGMKLLLKRDGVITIEFPHLLRLLQNVEFDTIYHEHFFYFSLFALRQVFIRHDLKLFDVEEIPTHGGSLRVYLCNADDTTHPVTSAVPKVQKDERAYGLDRLETYGGFARKVEECRVSLTGFVGKLRASGDTLLGYGAAAKGNTLLNFCGITPADIPAVADRNPHKQGKILPGTHIPIIEPQELLRRQPRYVLILPWNIKDEVTRQLAEISKWGGQFLIAIPILRVLT